MNKNILVIGLIIIAGLVLFMMTGHNSDVPEENDAAVMEDLSAAEFQQKRKEEPGVIIDVRTEEEYQQGHLAQADHHFDLLNGDFKAQLRNLDKDQTYYLYCRSGNRSGKAAQLMKDNGFTMIYNIGGFQDLVESGLQKK